MNEPVHDSLDKLHELFNLSVEDGVRPNLLVKHNLFLQQPDDVLEPWCLCNPSDLLQAFSDIFVFILDVADDLFAGSFA